MATIKRRVAPRKKARVTESEPARAPSKPVMKGSATVTDDGKLEIAVQLAETVPVAQYANVVLGPVGLRWAMANPGIDKLGVVDWDDPELDEEQQEIYDTVRGWLRATSKLVEHQIAEDREIVEESVRLHNEREAAEEEAAKKKSKEQPQSQVKTVDIERALLTKALSTKDGLPELVARGIDPDHFADEDLAELYEWAVDFMAKHAAPPSMTITKEQFRDFQPLLTKDPLSWHIDQFVRRVKERLAVELVRDYHDMLEDPAELDEIELRALEMARELTEVVPSPKARRFSEGTARKQEYERRKKQDITLGIPTGIPTLDDITLGIQPHELMIWGGPPGGGKTTALQFCTMSGYLHGETVLFVSLEVEAEQILRKFDTMMSHIEYHALKALKLDDENERKWYEILERAEEEKMHKDIIIVDDIRNCTVDKVIAQQIRYKPGVVAVDYLEEMRTPRNVQGWEGVASNGRGLKQQARTTRTPYITATQLNREGETSYQSAQKIADMLVVLIPPDDDEADSTEMTLYLRKYRDGPSRRSVKMHWDLNTMDIYELESTNGKFPERKLGRKSASTQFPVREKPLGLKEMVAKRHNSHG